MPSAVHSAMLVPPARASARSHALNASDMSRTKARTAARIA